MKPKLLKLGLRYYMGVMNPEEYGELLGQVQASNLALVGLSVANHGEANEYRSCKPPVLADTVEFSRDGESVVIAHGYHASIQDEDSLDAATVRIDFRVILHSGKELPDEFLSLYIQRQLPLITRPYARELLNNLAARMLLNCPPLPTKFIQRVPPKSSE